MVTTALSDYRCDVETLVVDGSNAAARVRFSGVHQGEFLGYVPTGRRVEWIGAAFFVEEDGVLRDIWVLGDLTSLRAQLAS
jgi:predicted ester cyclase